MDELRVGFVGAGRISDLHALKYLATDHARTVATSDINPDSTRPRAEQWGVPSDRILADFHDLLALPGVDLVEILLPHHLHYQATLDAAAPGRPSHSDDRLSLGGTST
ncbi:MAG: Gfo/Idh/MocA family oxidoreductase [Chloroflexi bacterium]|nr:Gfo/Idh/MocA family oxidoreductase [Chloroflexota bacterium]